jgi:hypothetical protein
MRTKAVNQHNAAFGSKETFPFSSLLQTTQLRFYVSYVVLEPQDIRNTTMISIRNVSDVITQDNSTTINPQNNNIRIQEAIQRDVKDFFRSHMMFIKDPLNLKLQYRPVSSDSIPMNEASEEPTLKTR